MKVLAGSTVCGILSGPATSNVLEGASKYAFDSSWLTPRCLITHLVLLVQPSLVVDNSEIFPPGLIVPYDSAYDEETFHATHFKQ